MSPNYLGTNFAFLIKFPSPSVLVTVGFSHGSGACVALSCGPGCFLRHELRLVSQVFLGQKILTFFISWCWSNVILLKCGSTHAMLLCAACTGTFSSRPARIVPPHVQLENAAMHEPLLPIRSLDILSGSLVS